MWIVTGPSVAEMWASCIPIAVMGWVAGGTAVYVYVYVLWVVGWVAGGTAVYVYVYVYVYVLCVAGGTTVYVYVWWGVERVGEVSTFNAGER
jgi:hypothetical protein